MLHISKGGRVGHAARGGDLYCELRGNRVKISGQAVTYSKGIIETTVS